MSKYSPSNKQDYSNFNTPLGADINILDNYVPDLILLLIPLLQI